MKRTLFAMASALVISVAFVSGVMAQQSTPPASQSAQGAPAKMEKSYTTFRGTIEKMDQGAKEIDVKKGNEEMTFTWSDQTKFMQGKKELTFSDLKKGEQISVVYTKQGDKLTAERIYVKMKTTAHKKSM